MKTQHFYDEPTSTLSYVVWDENTKDSVVIDPVLNFNISDGSHTLDSVNQLTNFINKEGLKLHYIIETHAHADHISGSQELKNNFNNAKVVIGQEITLVQETFKTLFKLSKDFPTDGSQFDLLYKNNQILKAGSLDIKTIHTPGHTPSCYSLLIEDAVFTGDALFMPDFGTGRCDFPKGSADDMYKSVSEKLYTLPNETRLFTGHDYQPGGRELMFETTIGESKKSNIQLNTKTSKEEYISFRSERDKKLSAPKLLKPSIIANIDAGHLPE